MDSIKALVMEPYAAPAFVWAILIVLLIVFILASFMGWFVTSSSFEGMKHAKLVERDKQNRFLRHLNPSASHAGRHALNSDFSQPQPHVPRYSHAVTQAHPSWHAGGQKRVPVRGKKRSGFSGQWADAGPRFVGPDLDAKASMYFVQQSQQAETAGQWDQGGLTRDYDQSSYADLSTYKAPVPDQIGAGQDSGYMTDTQLMGGLHFASPTQL